ncbi:hypothetical protein K474DRAFT_617339 [Panus rudis PR-1116 ss-1]|nr:hypothetical protein K474DRAFT_617339 [Panus rudis PR-1116 ss-1]
MDSTDWNWENLNVHTKYFWDTPGSLAGIGQVYDIPEWTIDLCAEIGGHWEPLIRKNPRNIVRILKNLRQAEQDHPPTQQWLFLVDLLDWLDSNVPSHQDVLAVLESGIIEVLVGMLLDRRTYNSEYPLVTNQLRFTGIILLLLCMLGEDAASHLYPGDHDCDCEAHSQPPSDSIHRAVQATSSQLPLLWRLIWQKRPSFLDNSTMISLKRPSDRKNKRFFVNVVTVVQVTIWCRLSASCSSALTPNDSLQMENELRPLLYAWTFPASQHDTGVRERLLLYVAKLLQTIPEIKQKSPVDDVFRVARERGSPRQTIYTALDALQKSPLNMELEASLTILNSICICAPSIACSAPRRHRAWGRHIFCCHVSMPVSALQWRVQPQCQDHELGIGDPSFSH